MQIKNMILAFIVAGSLAACGGGSRAGGGGNNDQQNSVSFAEAAYDFLKSGDVVAAQTNYDAALVADSTNTNAAFGAAFSRILQLPASTPSTNLLASFGQSPIQMSNLLGPTSYMAAVNANNTTSDDTINNTDPDLADYFPFFGLLPSEDEQNEKTDAVIFSQTTAGLTSADLIAQAMDYAPLWQEIADLLAQADQSNDFQFVLPKELYYGTQDVPLNRIDLKLLRSNFEFLLSDLYMANSWNFFFTLDGLYDSNGHLLISQQEIVDQLNQFFTLKADHQLDLAQEKFSSGLQMLLDAHDLVPSITVDGIVDNTTDTTAGYDELDAAASVIQQSLASQQSFAYVDPVVNINLNAFFNAPPDASEVDIDPYVLEDGQIRPVEGFFEEVLRGTIDLNLAQQYRTAFTSIQSPFSENILDEFQAFFVAGVLVLHVGGNDLGD